MSGILREPGHRIGGPRPGGNPAPDDEADRYRDHRQHRHRQAIASEPPQQQLEHPPDTEADGVAELEGLQEIIVHPQRNEQHRDHKVEHEHDRELPPEARSCARRQSLRGAGHGQK